MDAATCCGSWRETGGIRPVAGSQPKKPTAQLAMPSAAPSARTLRGRRRKAA